MPTADVIVGVEPRGADFDVFVTQKLADAREHRRRVDFAPQRAVWPIDVYLRVIRGVFTPGGVNVDQHARPLVVKPHGRSRRQVAAFYRAAEMRCQSGIRIGPSLDDLRAVKEGETADDEHEEDEGEKGDGEFHEAYCSS